MAEQVNDLLEQKIENSGGEEVGKKSKQERPEQALRRYGIALTNAIGDTAINTELGKYNFNKTHLTEIHDLWKVTDDLFAKQKKEMGERLDASGALDMAYEKADTCYKIALTIARTVFKNDPNAYVSLMLGGKRKNWITGWCKQADTFYRNMLSTPEFMKKMAWYGYTEAKFNEEYRLVLEVVKLDATHKREMGEAQEATEVRDRSFDRLEEYMDSFYMIAQIALASFPQWLEKLGIKQASY